jgi:RNA polymerase sigma-70 factor (sigma-E family)
MMALMHVPTRGGAQAEFERFVDGCADELLRAAYLIAWDLAEAEDLVQETLLRVARRWPRVRRMERPGAYARRILVNLAVGGAGRRSRRRRELDPDGSDSLDGCADESAASAFGALDTRSELLAALGALAPLQRTVLVLRYFEDLSEAQTAQALGCSVGTVKSTASRGLARLRQDYQPHDAPLAHSNGHRLSDKEPRHEPSI